MLKAINRVFGDPVTPSFLIEVMAQDLVKEPFGRYQDEVRWFLASASEGVADSWPDPAGLGPDVNTMTSSERSQAAKTLEDALELAEQAIRLEDDGQERAAVEEWRRLFSWRMPRLLSTSVSRDHPSERFSCGGWLAVVPAMPVHPSISERQNSTESIELLRADTHFYLRAKRLHALRVAGALILALLAPVILFWKPGSGGLRWSPRRCVGTGGKNHPVVVRGPLREEGSDDSGAVRRRGIRS